MSKKRKLTGLEVAVIGMSLKFPGAENKDEYWDNLKNGIESIKKFSDEELLKAGVRQEMLDNPAYVKSGVSIKDKECFDSKFFEYRPEEAKLMNPQTRIFHQCAWEALEDSGYVPGRYDGIIGLYAGAKSDINWETHTLLFNADTSVDEFSSRIFRKVDYFCTSIAYKLNLKGPAVFINTAGSTSLVAIHMAAMSLITGETNVALAGGITLSSSHPEGYLYQKGMINSPDGHLRAFDEKANGIVPGEGAGVVVLKMLDKALKDGDNIYAIIKGSAINNDGNRKVGYSAPAVSGQSNVIKAAQVMSRVKPESISYVEAHGTGTSLGDPVEIEALSYVFGKSEQKYCSIGSVKSNIGHTDSAAGVAGFIKTVLALKNRQIPPTLHFEKLNNNINLKGTPFTINSELKEWKSDEYPLRAGVSSFGIGGTNAHVILEEAIEKDDYTIEEKDQLLVFSAKTVNSLKEITSKYSELFQDQKDVNLADVAWTLQTGRSMFPYRFKLAAKNVQEALELLMKRESDQAEVHKIEGNKKSVVFIFSGSGSQYVNMGRDIYEDEPLFKEQIDQCFSILNGLMGVDFKEILYPTPSMLEDAEVKINQPQYLYPLLFAIEYGLAGLLERWGVKPDYLIGDGIGEYVVACLSGLFSLEDALRLVVKTGELVRKVPQEAMQEVAAVTEELTEILANEVKAITFNNPNTLWISSVTGKRVSVEEVMFAEYWNKHFFQTAAQQHKGCATILQEEKNCIFVEVGPGNDLSSLKETLGDCMAINLLKRSEERGSDLKLLLDQVGELWLQGVNLEWEMFHWKETRKTVSVPTYCFEKKPYPLAKNMTQFLQENLKILDNEEIVVDTSIFVHEEEEIPAEEVNTEQVVVTVDDIDESLTNTEKMLVEIWKDFFDIEHVDINDDFFEIGGDSLRAMGLVIELEENFDTKISIEELFSLTTIAELAQYIDSNMDQYSNSLMDNDDDPDDHDEDLKDGDDDKVRITI
ncbi:MAG: acyltransferase domain-containing protein [Halanaerobiales bacterium]|nr:acyltransferase domain-containing protein [Halanaerobiales bacterium]